MTGTRQVIGRTFRRRELASLARESHAGTWPEE